MILNLGSLFVGVLKIGISKMLLLLSGVLTDALRRHLPSRELNLVLVCRLLLAHKLSIAF